MQKPTTHEKLRTALTDDRYRILEVLAKHDELRSSEISDLAEIPDGSKHYQLTLLESWRLIESAGTQYVGEHDTGIPATIYALIEKGHAVVAER